MTVGAIFSSGIHLRLTFVYSARTTPSADTITEGVEDLAFFRSVTLGVNGINASTPAQFIVLNGLGGVLSPLAPVRFRKTSRATA